MSKKQLQGIVVSTKMAPTIIVEVERILQHPKYKKRFGVNKRYKAHYEGDGVQEGDRVTIVESRPISKDKRWRVVEEGATGSETEETEGQEQQ